MELCRKHRLTVPATWMKREAEECWARASWDVPPRLSSLDVSLVSSQLVLARCSPWPAVKWHKERVRLWGDHRPICFLAAVEDRDSFRVASCKTLGSYTGWRLAEGAYGDFCASLDRTVSEEEGVCSVSEISRKLLECCVQAPHSTAAQRRANCCPPPPGLVEARRVLRSRVDLSAEEVRKLRKRERGARRMWNLDLLKVRGGIRGVRRLEQWQPVTHMKISGEMECSRSAWKEEVVRHWQQRFGDPHDCPLEHKDSTPRCEKALWIGAH